MNNSITNFNDILKDERAKFYLNCVNNIIKEKTSKILVCGGGVLDKAIFEALNFKYVTISNLDTRMNENEYFPFNWKFEDAASLSFENESFGFVVIHAAIHHASSPHKVLTEMYRVSKIGILAFESRDSLTMRILEKLKLTQTYEHTAVFYNDCKYGGVNNTEIPNYIYRWTEREIEKTIQSYSPYFKHKYIYRYGTAFPCTPELQRIGWFKYCFLKIIRPLSFIFFKLFPKQQNQFSFYVEKQNVKESLFPWLVIDENKNIIFNREWGKKNYKKTPEISNVFNN
ncbi:methyltransferase family protein [Treponema primitia ZAS-2]|uniref:Methyltransferase family protein n=1 Tax=Treponema primitia (strain ATCC BAA-887 / DSM 12427 / ZAS-2) TaxID=545694 RepID=F5YMD2_TREPZ|nr:methyltransferase domain-containing protein [Treponema primitia]AEF84765.1 methyltransferase family protein [Treponema primitia ZAS-2]